MLKSLLTYSFVATDGVAATIFLLLQALVARQRWFSAPSLLLAVHSFRHPVIGAFGRIQTYTHIPLLLYLILALSHFEGVKLKSFIRFNYSWKLNWNERFQTSTLIKRRPPKKGCAVESVRTVAMNSNKKYLPSIQHIPVQQVIKISGFQRFY